MLNKRWIILLGLLFSSGSVYPQIGSEQLFVNHLQRQCSVCQIAVAQQPSYRFLFSSNELVFHRLHQHYIPEPALAFRDVLEYISLCETHHRSQHLVEAYLGLGSMFRKRQLYDQAILAFRKADDYARHYHKDDEGLKAMVCLNLAGFYQEARHDNAEALNYYQRILHMRPFVMSDSLLSLVHNNMGICYLEDGDYQQAGFHHKISLALKERLKDSTGIAVTYNNLGDLYFQMQQDEHAEQYFRKAVSVAEGIRNRQIENIAYLNLAYVYEAKGDYRKAFELYQQYIALRDTLWSNEKVWELARIKEKVEVSDREKRIGQLHYEVALSDLELRDKEHERNWLLAGTVALLVVALLMLLAYRREKRYTRIIAHQKQQLEELNQTKNKIFTIIGHDLRSPLSTIYNVSQLMQREDKKGAGKEELETIQQNAKGLLTLLNNLLTWGLVQTSQLFVQRRSLQLSAIAEQVIEDILAECDLKKISCTTDIPTTILVEADTNSLRLTIRNILGNALKYTPSSGHIRLKARALETGQAELCIEDNGIGIPPEKLGQIFEIGEEKIRLGLNGEKGSGIGLWLCRQMMSINQGHIRLEQSPEGGTRVWLVLPMIEPPIQHKPHNHEHSTYCISS